MKRRVPIEDHALSAVRTHRFHGHPVAEIEGAVTLNRGIHCSDGTAGGVIQALKSQGLDGKIMVTGQDADLMACKRILVGTQSMTVYKPLRTLAIKAAQLAVIMSRGEVVETNQSIHNGEKEVPSILLDPVKLHKGNLVDILTRDEYYSREVLLK